MAQGVFEGRAITAKLIKVPTIRGQILNAMKTSRREVLRIMYLTVATWKHSVTFESYIAYRGGNLQLGVWTTDRPWNLLNRGTAIRYATMTPDFRAKSIPRVIGSLAGAGGKQYVNRRHPRPGIEARRWTETAVRIHNRRFNELIGVAIFKGMLG